MIKKSSFLVLAVVAFIGLYSFLRSSPVHAQTQGIWIEAEKEASSFIYPAGQRPATNMKETNPSWRPPYFGSGDWYLAKGGEYLTYNFSVPQGGRYNVWIRDYVDKFQARGVRRVIVEFDGKGYGVFPEVNIPSQGEKGAFGWHRVGGGVELEAGAHKMKITKEATTAGAAVLDAFYLTIGDEAPPKKTPSEPIEEPLTDKTSLKYPIAELGNCRNEADCKSYCTKSENLLACSAFGEKNGLISPEDAKKAREFADVLRGEGPGGCKDQKSCENYCSDISRVNECVSFAEKHNLIPPEQLKEAKQVAKALSEGGKLPGGCRDKNSCESYCSDATHSDECLSFAEKAGFVSSEEAAQARKALPLIARGESPGKCKNKAECEQYCSNESNTLECVDFAEKAGFMTGEEAAMVRKTGGKGPGGCRSKESCETYCNDPQNQEACFAFAQEHDLIPPEKLKEMKEGMGRLRAGLKQMPEEAVQCLKEQLGDDVISKIEGGTFAPGPKTGEAIQGCVAKSSPKIREQIEMGLKNAPPETRECLDKGLGEGGLDKVLSGAAPTPEMGDVMRNCFESAREAGLKQFREGLKQMPPEIKKCIEEKLGGDTVAKIESGEPVDLGPESANVIQSCAGDIGKIIDQQLQQAPPEIRDCIKSKIGDPSKIRGPQDIQPLIQECVQSFIPKGIPGGFGPSGFPTGAPGFSGNEPYSGATYGPDFVGECDPGWNLELNPQTNRKYCAISQEKCAEKHPGTTLAKDEKGYSVCWIMGQKDGGFKLPEGIPKGFEEFIPKGLPKGAEEFIPKNIPGVTPGGIPSGIPGGLPAIPPGGIPEGFQIPDSACAAFKMAPSCDYVPESVRDLCKKCRS